SSLSNTGRLCQQRTSAPLPPPQRPLLPAPLPPQQILRRPAPRLRLARQSKKTPRQRVLRQPPPLGGLEQFRLDCLLEQLFGPQQGRQMPRNPIQGRRPRAPRAVLLGRLDLLPIGPHLVDILDFDRAKHMRMPPHQLLGGAPGNPLKINPPALEGKLPV